MSKLKYLLKILLKAWLKFAKLWNNTMIIVLLLVIWLFILTPTALIRRFFQTIKNKSATEPDSFLKKSEKLDSEHFIRPF